MTKSVTPVEVIRRNAPYRVPRAKTPIDLYLDGNEGAAPPKELLDALDDADTDTLRRYPDTEPLHEALASHLGVNPHHLLVTAGADDAIDRVCRAVLQPGRNMVVPVPTFTMIPRFAEMTGAEVRRVEAGDGDYPLEAVIDAIDENTSLIIVVSPNNPTGVAAAAEQIETLATRCPQALLLVDHAYGEFGGDDFTSRAPEFPNVVVTRTLSKAWGLAGLRVGYAVADEERIQWLATAGNPYPVSRLSVLVAAKWLATGDDEVERFVRRVRGERCRLQASLDDLGISHSDSRANFVFARVGDGLWWRDAMAGMGIGVRAFPGRPGLEDAVRIACPGDRDDCARVQHAIHTIAAPEAILFDVDGVLCDVSRSYRQAIAQTAAHFGAEVTDDEITRAKAAGDANNDWRVTQRLLESRGIDVSLDEVTEHFERLYQGTQDNPGLWAEETLLLEPELLTNLREQGLKLGIVTGRPRRDARRFLEHFGLDEFFSAAVCMEDGPNKPDPAPVLQALEELDVTRAWFIGDTPDDMRAGRGANVLPLGIVAPGEDGPRMNSALLSSGAGRILDNLQELLETLTLQEPLEASK